MNINYEYYKIFYYVAKYKSFTKAANALFNNQPNISRTIHKLEESLNCKLFIRSKSGLVLTPEGEKLFNHIQIAHEQIAMAEEDLLKKEQLVSGSISLGITETALNIFLLDKLEIFKKKYPGIHLRISNHSTPQALSALDKGIVDIAIVATPTYLKASMRQTQLMEFKDVMISGPNQKELSTHINSLKDLNQYPLIMLGKETMTYSFFNEFYSFHKLELNSEIDVATTDQVLPLIKHNLGIGFLPYPFAKESIDKKEIFEIPLKEQIPKRHIVFITDQRYPLSVAAKEFIKTLKM